MRLTVPTFWGAWTVQRPELPPQVRAALGLARRERVLAAARDDGSGTWVVATTWSLVAVREGAEVVRRPWHLVDAGVWQDETWTLTVTWVDGRRPVQWVFREQQTLLPETVRERVQASVVLATRLVLGERRTARVAIRQDLATGELVPQTVLGRGVRADDPGTEAQLRLALAELRDQVGLPR